MSACKSRRDDTDVILSSNSETWSLIIYSHCSWRYVLQTPTEDLVGAHAQLDMDIRRASIEVSTSSYWYEGVVYESSTTRGCGVMYPMGDAYAREPMPTH